MDINMLLANSADDILRVAASHGATDVRVFGAILPKWADANSGAFAPKHQSETTRIRPQPRLAQTRPRLIRLSQRLRIALTSTDCPDDCAEPDR